MSTALNDHYRCPEELLSLSVAQGLQQQPGYFRFGTGAIAYGHSTLGSPVSINSQALPDLTGRVSFLHSTVELPFETSQVVDNLRRERYPLNGHEGIGALRSNESVRRSYYYLRPMLPDSLRRMLQRLFLRDWDKLPFPQWPVDTSVERILEKLLVLSMKARKIDRIPFIWFWPDGAPASAIVTHDVETSVGLNSVPSLMDVDDEFGIKTSFQLVPEKRYTVSRTLREVIRGRHCEVNVHGLNHDGNLFRDRETFLKQARWINQYVREFGSEGFRAACMYRNLEWLNELDISYDMSVPNVAHLEPQRGGCCTVFPYFAGRVLELPLTTAQDYSLFHILGDYSIELWKKQIDIILKRHGLISFIAHPDYLVTQKAMTVYRALLAWLSKLRNQEKLWIARPGDVNRWWRQRHAMNIEWDEGKWSIRGQGRERARIAFACLRDDEIEYEVGESFEARAESQVDSNTPLGLRSV